MNLRAKLLVLLVPLVVVPLLGVGAAAYVQLQQTSERKTLDQMATVLDLIAGQTQSVLATARANVQLLSTQNLVRQYLLADDPEERYQVLQSPLLRQLIAYQETYPNYYEIRILMPDGYEDLRWTRVPLPNATEDEGGNSWFRGAQAAPDDIYSAFVRDPDTGDPALVVSKRIQLRDRTKDGIGVPTKLRGYLVVTIDLGFLTNLLLENVVSEQGFLIVTDTDGKVLIHADRPEANALLQVANGPPTHQSEDPNIGDHGELPASLFDNLARHAETGSALRAKLSDHLFLFLGKRMEGNLYLFAAMPDAELRYAGRKLGVLVAGVVLAAVLIATMLLFFTLDRLLVRPVKQLGEAFREVGRGNLDAKVRSRRRDEIGELANMFDDMSENLRVSDERIRYLAYHDPLTGLPNRMMFQEYLNHALADARRRHQMLVLLFLDLDNFKNVNDMLGHQVGDALLQIVAERLQQCLRGADYIARLDATQVEGVVARLGGDEFIVMLTGLKDPYEATVVAHRILTSLAEPIQIQDNDLYVSASVGITTSPADGDDVATLIKHADIAMYHAKQQGKNNYQYFSDKMNTASLHRLTMANKLRKALEQDQFLLHYQPKIDVRSMLMVGVEALIRWRDPEVGMVQPDVFIPIAEETGIITAIGEWVLQEACRQTKAWQEAGLDVVPVSVNASGVQVARKDFPDVIAKALRESKLDPRYLEIELTETSIMSALERGAETLREIRALGVSISVDDFGTGYSSLSYLRHFPIDTLKIDRGFIGEIGNGTDDTPIISAIIAMAHALNLTVVAEGVETEHQTRYLVSKDCDTMQGFLLGRPVPPEQISAQLVRRGLPPLEQHQQRGHKQLPGAAVDDAQLEFPG